MAARCLLSAPVVSWCSCLLTFSGTKTAAPALRVGPTLVTANSATSRTARPTVQMTMCGKPLKYTTVAPLVHTTVAMQSLHNYVSTECLSWVVTKNSTYINRVHVCKLRECPSWKWTITCGDLPYYVAAPPQQPIQVACIICLWVEIHTICMTHYIVRTQLHSWWKLSINQRSNAHPLVLEK